MNRIRHYRDVFALQWLGLALLLALLCGTSAYLLYREHAHVAETEEERLLMTTRVLEVSIARNLGAVNSVLLTLRDELKAGAVNGNFTERIKTLAEAMPSVRTLTVHAGDGRIRAASRTELIGRNDGFAERPYVVAPRSNPDPDMLYISAPFRTVLGVFSITASRMIPGPRGEFAGVVTATLDPMYFNPVLDSVRYAPGMAAALQHEDGVVFLAVPASQDRIVGKNLAVPGSFFMQHKDSGQSVTVFTGTLLASGEERMVAQRNVRPADLKMDKAIAIAVTRRVDDIYQSWRRTALEVAGLLALTSLLLAGGLYAFQRGRSAFHAKEAQSRRALAESESRLKTIIGTVPECVKVLRLDGTLSQMNPAGLAILEADTEEQVLGSRLEDFVAPAYRAAFTSLVQRVACGESGTLEFESIGLKGGHRWLESHAVPLRDASGSMTGILSVTRDITERKQGEREMERLAQVDFLTGLANRRHFMKLAEQEVSRTARYGGALSALMIDIDHFKKVNDAHGHQAGDRVLQRFGEVLRETLREVDFAGRLGGEEFAVLLPQTDGARAVEAAERLRQRVARQPSPEDGDAIPITVSIGVATLAPGETGVDSLIRRADTALYQAKRGGRNQVSRWSGAAPASEV